MYVTRATLQPDTKLNDIYMFKLDDICLTLDDICFILNMNIFVSISYTG